MAKPQLGPRSQSLVARNHLSYCDLDLRRDAEQPAAGLQLPPCNTPITGVTATYDGPLVRSEVEGEARPLQRQAEAAVDAADLAIHVDQREVET